MTKSLRCVPPGWKEIADLDRGDFDGGILVQNTRTRMLAIWTSAGSIQSVPQNKAIAALARMNSADTEN